MDWAEVQARVQGIEGFISDNEAEYLCMLAKKCGGTIVEIGSWKGKSTVYLALGSKAGSGGKVYSIDPHRDAPDYTGAFGGEDTEPIFRENIKRAGVDDIVTPMVMKSEEAAKGWTQPISLLWIDGAHDYENVKKDFLSWAPYLREGGIIAFDDAINPRFPDVRKLVNEYIFPSSKFSNVHFCEVLLCATKVTRLPIRDRFFKFQKSVIYHTFPFAQSALNFMAPTLAKVRLLALVRKVKDRVLALIG